MTTGFPNPVDDLWRCAQGQLPTTLPGCAPLFARTFCPGAKLVNVEVGADNAPTCALPMIVSRQYGVTAGRLPVNEWMKCGDLAIRDGNSHEESLNSLCGRVLELGARIHDFNWVRDDSSWKCLIGCFRKLGCHIDTRALFEVGVIDINGDWETYWKSRSKNHRKQMNSAWKGLGEFGLVRFERHFDIACPEQLNRLMDEAIEIEHGGWKGESGTSIRSRPEVEEFYRNIGGELNRRGVFELQFLRAGDVAVAFEWGYRLNGTYHSHKIGYRREYAGFSPGQLLLFAQLQEFFATGNVSRVDTMGILSPATARWITDKYQMMRYRVSSPRLLDRWVWSAACGGRDAARKLRDSIRKGNVE
jgi:Acetyltransferase (GNAT) domain